MRGIQSFEIESILQFIYLGEATFYQERMDEFINVAKSLEIKQISKGIEIPENGQHDNYETKELDPVNELPATDSLPKQISKGIQHKSRQLNQNNENKYPCDECNYEAKFPHHLRQHIKSIHERIKYPCDQCNFKATDPSYLRRHIKSIHERVKYPCIQCNYKATVPSALSQHVKSIHEGVKAPSPLTGDSSGW